MPYVIKSITKFDNPKTGKTIINEFYFKRIAMGLFAEFGKIDEAMKFDYRHQAVTKLNEIGKRKKHSIVKI